MDSDDGQVKRTSRNRSRGARGAPAGRPRGRGRARGRGRRARVISSDEETSVPDPPSETVPDDVVVKSEPDVIEVVEEPSLVKTSLLPEILCEKENDITTISAIDISQLEAPTFTTIQRGPPEPMLRLKWDHKVSLIGEKVLNPMIHCCDQCLKPILIYGRMIPCKHIFCLKCARAEPLKVCPRCKDKVGRVEQSGLGTVFMCTHGGSRYGNTGCRRTYLSQRDLQAHINHRHVSTTVTGVTDSSAALKTLVADSKNQTASTQRKQQIDQSILRPNTSRGSQAFSSSISVIQPAGNIPTRTNLITVPIQDSHQQQQHQQQQQQQQHGELNSNYYNAGSQQSFGSSTYNSGSAQSNQATHQSLSTSTGHGIQSNQQGSTYYSQQYSQQYNQQVNHYQSNRQQQYEQQQNYGSSNLQNQQQQQWSQQYYR